MPIMQKPSIWWGFLGTRQVFNQWQNRNVSWKESAFCIFFNPNSHAPVICSMKPFTRLRVNNLIGTCVCLCAYFWTIQSNIFTPTVLNVWFHHKATQNQNQNVHLFDPHTIYIIAIYFYWHKEVDPETPAKTSLKMCAISSDTHQLQFIKLHHFKQERF